MSADCICNSWDWFRHECFLAERSMPVDLHRRTAQPPHAEAFSSLLRHCGVMVWRRRGCRSAPTVEYAWRSAEPLVWRPQRRFRCRWMVSLADCHRPSSTSTTEVRLRWSFDRNAIPLRLDRQSMSTVLNCDSLSLSAFKSRLKTRLFSTAFC